MSLSSNVATARATNNTNVTSKTTSASIHPSDNGGGIDAAMALILQCTIDGVLSLGDASNRKILLGTGTTASPTGGVLIDPAGLISLIVSSLTKVAWSNGEMLFGNGLGTGPQASYGLPGLLMRDAIVGNHIVGLYLEGGTTPVLEIGDGGTHKVKHKTNGAFSADRTVLWPNKDGSGVLGDSGSSTQTLSSAATMVIAHGLAYNPSHVFLTPKTAAAGDALALHYYATTDATNITINFQTGTASGSVTIDWFAIP